MRSGSARWRWAAIAAIGACVLVIGYYALLSPKGLPDHRMLRGHNDLVLHVLAFLVLSVPVLALRPGRLAALGLAGFAVVIELAQFATPRRTPALDDLAAGILGIGLGALLVWAVRRRG